MKAMQSLIRTAENEEYAVVSKETYNGLVRYDRIVKNADKVSEQDILY